MSYRRYPRVFDKALSNALIDLATVKAELGIAEDDASKDDVLEREIKQMSAAASGYCRRIFRAEGIVDTFVWTHGGYGGGSSDLSLSRYPLSGFLLSPTTADTGSGLVLPIEDTSDAFDGETIVSGLNIPAGTTVSAHDEATVTLSNPITGLIPSGSLIAFGLVVTACPNTPSARVLVPGQDYLVDEGPAILTRAHCGSFGHWGGETISVRYWGGYAEDEIPADLQAALLRWITLRDQSRGLDPSVKSLEIPGVISTTRWVDANAPGIPAEITDTLDRYRVRMVG